MPMVKAKLRCFCSWYGVHRDLPSFPTRRSSDLLPLHRLRRRLHRELALVVGAPPSARHQRRRSEEHTSELQSQSKLVCRLLLERKKADLPAGIYLAPLTATSRASTRSSELTADG